MIKRVYDTLLLLDIVDPLATLGAEFLYAPHTYNILAGSTPAVAQCY